MYIISVTRKKPLTNRRWLMRTLGKVVDTNGNVVGNITGFWSSQRVLFVTYTDGTQGYVGDERYKQNGYNVVY